MNLKNECCILSSGAGSWAFHPLANDLSKHIGVEVSDAPRRFNYLLHYGLEPSFDDGEVFIPVESIRIAADKRRQAKLFREHKVPSPETHLFENVADVFQHIVSRPDKEWCLKFPTGCGATGHQMLGGAVVIPNSWPKPFIVQEFIRMADPAVHRIYCAGGELFGWVARKYPSGKARSPWVAHARGARYVSEGEAPEEAASAARLALKACGLLDSFGAVDLLLKPDGTWVVLEVGTDGVFNHVDRELGYPALESTILEKITRAFWKRAEACLGAA